MTGRVTLSALLGVFVVAALSGCGDDDAEMPTATSVRATLTVPPKVTATATTGVTSGAATPISEAFRNFAASVDDAVRDGDGDFFRSRMRTEHVVCTEEDLLPRGPGGPGCLEAGQELDVIPSGVWLSEGADIEPDAAVEVISVVWRDEASAARDSLGGSEAQVYAVALWDDPEFGESYVTFVTAIIAPGPGLEELRAAFALLWQPSDTDYELVRILQTRTMAPLFLDPSQLDTQYLRAWERFEH